MALTISWKFEIHPNPLDVTVCIEVGGIVVTTVVVSGNMVVVIVGSASVEISGSMVVGLGTVGAG